MLAQAANRMEYFAGAHAQLLLQRSEGAAFRARVRSRLFAVLRDHTVSGRVLFPGAGSTEMALACARGALAGVRFTRPLIVLEGVVIGIQALEVSREARGVVSMHASARDGRALRVVESSVRNNARSPPRTLRRTGAAVCYVF